MANIKLIIKSGLVNDYEGTFNLNTDAKRVTFIDFVTNGDIYVDNSDSYHMHAGYSPYGESDGIKPICSTEKWIPSYGNNLRNYLSRVDWNFFYNNQGPEIYENSEAYKNYKNTFKIDFVDNSLQVALDEYNTSRKEFYKQYSYYKYNQEIGTFSDYNVYTTNLEAASSGIFMSMLAIHFSKYYPLYSITSGNEKCLKPLAYTGTDLKNYGITIVRNTEGDGEYGMPMMSKIWGLEYSRYHSGSHRHEEMLGYTGGIDDYRYLIGRDNMTMFANYNERTGDGHDFSWFYDNPNKKSVWDYIPKDNIPSGFSVFALFNYSSGNWTHYTIDGWDGTVRSEWTNVYKTSNGSSYSSILNNERKFGPFGSQYVSDSPVVGISYKEDTSGNIHIFNTFFPLQRSDNHISQTINYQDGYKGTRPRYIGQLPMSILASIYTYREEYNTNITYVSDIVYLSNNFTTYTKDIPFRMYTYSNGPLDQNSLILFKQSINLDAYISKLKSFIVESEETSEYKISKKNVTLKLKECVKNSPIQFKLNYLKPDLSIMGVNPYVMLYHIDGKEPERITSDIVRAGQLYQVDGNNIQYLNQNFKIRWVKGVRINPENNIIQVKWEGDNQATRSEYIYKTFQFDNDKLNLVQQTCDQPVYFVRGTQGSYSTDLYDWPHTEILLPQAMLR